MQYMPLQRARVSYEMVDGVMRVWEEGQEGGEELFPVRNCLLHRALATISTAESAAHVVC